MLVGLLLGHFLIDLAGLGTDVPLLDGAATTDLAGFDTIVLGVMAMARDDVDDDALRGFVEGCGNLLSFYQRADRGWQAETSRPRFLRVGTPSLRWRVAGAAPPSYQRPGSSSQ